MPEFSVTDVVLRHVPAGIERDELLRLVRVGQAFARHHHAGGTRGFLHRHVCAVVSRMPAPGTFEMLVTELQLDARRGDGPVRHVSRSFSTLHYLHPERGESHVSFGRLRNIFTEAKKENSHSR
jgi:hypothetical protein